MKHRSLMRTVALALTVAIVGCTEPPKQVAKPITTPYVNLPAKEVPEFLRGTIWEQVDIGNAGPMLVSGYGLVVGLNGTGDTRAPNVVREYMIKQMQKHGFGSTMIPGYEKLTPEQVLNDPLKRVAIVRVEGLIPPGARKGQLFDVQVTALENSNTTSLHRGILYQTDLTLRGTDPGNLGGGVVNPIARVSGPIMVNPAVATQDEEPTPAERLSLRRGIIMGRGQVIDDRPLSLRIRQAASPMARAVERRIQDRFQNSKVAAAKSPQEVWINVPPQYGDDWEHFAGVVTHLYFNSSSEFATLQAEKLAELADRERENAPLLDISYCWEAMGTPALPKIKPLLNHPSPDVQFAAARAAAFLRDLSAQETLARIAKTRDHPFQLNAIRVIGRLDQTVYTRQVLREMLNGDQLLARVQAYEAMLKGGDPIIVTRSVRDRFAIDLVPSDGPPIIYATRVGTPRIAFIGRRAALRSGGWFMGLKNELTLTQSGEAVRVFYRGAIGEKEADILCAPDAAVISARLGGDAPPGERRINLSYTDIVGILQRLCDAKLLVGPNGEPATFVLQSLPGTEDPILSAPAIPEQRPTSDSPVIQEAPSIDTVPSIDTRDAPPPSPLAPIAPPNERPAR